MAKIYPLIENFAMGELSPRMYLQSTLAASRQGVSELTNFVTTSQGPVQRRGGFNYTETIPGTYGRIFDFVISQAQGYVVTVSNDGFVRVNDNTGNVIDTDDDFVNNSGFTNGGDDWTVDASGAATVTFGDGLCVLAATSSQEAAIQQEITVTNAANLHLIRVVAPSVGERIIINVGTAQGLSDIASFDVTGLRVIAKTFTPGVATFWVEVRSPNDDLTDPVLDKVEVFEPGAAATIEFASPWEENDIRSLQVAMPSGEFAMYMVSPNIAPQKLSYTRATNSWTFAPVVFTAPPTEWTGVNFPGVIAFFQGRMWLGATPEQPETFWGSVSNEYENFTLGSGDAADSIVFSLSARGRIEWMQGVKNLLIGTENAEHIITSESGIVKSGDIQAERQSSYGSSNNQAEQIGNQVIYTSPDGRKIREMGFQWTDEGWISRDLTFIAEHITKGRPITETVWVQNPDNQLWGIGLNGDMVTATYERGYEILGWHKHITDGNFLSVTSLDNFGRSQLWTLVNRNGTEMFLERYDPDDFVDSYVTINNNTPSDIITIPHLADKTVSVVTDGAVHPDVLLDNSGVGTLQTTATNVVAGLPYVSTFRTLPLDFGAPQGSGRPYEKRWVKIFVYLIDSHKPIINGVRPPTRHPSTPMNTAEPPASEFAQVLDLGYDLQAIVEVIQDLPISCMVGGIFGEMQMEAL